MLNENRRFALASLTALINAGWDEIFYPDEIDKLKDSIRTEYNRSGDLDACKYAAHQNRYPQCALFNRFAVHSFLQSITLGVLCLLQL